MALTDALNIFLADGRTKDKLLEIQGGLIENVQKEAVSQIVKNSEYSGDPNSGSVKFKRFAYSTVNDYGTARAAGHGDAIKNTDIIVNLDQHKEIIENAELFDLERYGLDGIVEKRRRDFEKKMISFLDRMLFQEIMRGIVVEATANEITPTSTTVQGKIEELILALETTSNTFVDGVDRSDMFLVVTPTIYSSLRDYLETIYNTNVDSTKEIIQMYHGVRIFSSNRMNALDPTTDYAADMLCFTNKSVSQPISARPIIPEKLEQSEKIAIPLFFHYGVKLLTPDLAYAINITPPTPAPPQGG